MPNPNVETAEKRLDPLKKALVGIGVAATIGVGLVTDNYLNADITLHGKKYTEHEYSQLKPILEDKITNRKNQTLTFDEGETWKGMVNRELKKCGKPVVLTNVTDKNIIDLLNEKVKKGDCL